MSSTLRDVSVNMVPVHALTDISEMSYMDTVSPTVPHVSTSSPANDRKR